MKRPSDGRGRDGPARLAVALIPPFAFIVQEHLERLLHDRTFPWHLAAQQAFLRGLVLQIPFALLALGLATVIAGTVRRVVDAIREPVRRAAPRAASLRSRATAGERALRIFSGNSEPLRAPPTSVL